MMHNPWGIVVAAVGLLMSLGGITKSNFFLYRMIVSRQRHFLGDRVHSYFIVAGLIMAVFGVLLAVGVIPSRN